MKQVLILRHAKAERIEPGGEDHGRVLTRRGLRDATRVGHALLAESLVPEMILCSTAVRARSTADLCAAACAFQGELRIVPWLYPGDAARTLGYLRELAESVGRVMVVGHNPSVEELAAVLTGRGQTMPTACLAVVATGAARWPALAPGAGELRRLWRPADDGA